MSLVNDDRVYFRQLLAGRDIAADNRMARQMVNFVYLIGDRDTGECVVVDPAWGPADIVNVAAADGMRITGALASHYHMDHIGGSLMGQAVDGVRELLEIVGLKVHCHRDELEFVRKTTGISESDVVAHDSGDTVMVGAIPIELIHTPGHTPGSQCFFVADCLVSGDTLFLDGCGRTDFPGSDPEAMYDSLHNRLARIPDESMLFPGHWYAPEPAALMGDTRRSNYVLAPRSKETWLAMFGSG